MEMLKPSTDLNKDYDFVRTLDDGRVIRVVKRMFNTQLSISKNAHVPVYEDSW